VDAVADAGVVLVVDDTESVRTHVTSQLQRSGRSAMTASNGEEALALLEREGRRIGLVLLDLSMPVLDGVETLKRLRRSRPELPVILMSGYDGTETAGRLGALRADSFLQKPFRFSQLEVELRRLSGPPQGTRSP
jgi:CheY-like chemotaxis protein